MYSDEVIEYLGEYFIEYRIKERFKLKFDQFLYIMITFVWEKTKDGHSR